MLRSYKNKAGSFRVMKMILFLFFLAGGLWSAPEASAQKKNKDNDKHTSRYYVSRAQEFADANSWEAAKREIDAGLELYPSDPDLRYLNGRYYYYAHRDLPKARYNLVKAIQESDHHWGARRVLIDVEDDSKHYSSAICYVNELLEQQPYDRDLWRRKITLYNKMGNRVEADAALERLARIYPNDTTLQNQLRNRTRENWNRRLNPTSLGERISTMEEWIDNDPKNLDNYMELSDLYIKIGDYEAAMNTAKRGLVQYPKNARLVQRVSSLMSEQGLYTRALSFLQENGQGNGKMYQGMMREAANDARLKDPYEINGRLYAQTRDRDALNYLLNTALTRNYYDDAMMYLREAYKLEGRTTKLLLKEYDLHRRMGNQNQAHKILEELYRINPKEAEFRDQYLTMQLELANIDAEQEEWEDAYERLTIATGLMEVGSAQWIATVSRRINLLGKMDRTEEARSLYNEASSLCPDKSERFANAYEEIFSNRIKGLIEDEQYAKALTTAQDLLAIVPDSEMALRACINMSQTLKRQDMFYQYAEQGYMRYPDQPYFIVKQAIALQEQNRYFEALQLLNPQKPGDTYPNTQLINPFAGVSIDWAVELLHNHLPDMALLKINDALEWDPDNTELLYLKGLAYEQMKDFKQAYYYQSRYYNPSNAEQSEWNEHMRYLRYRSFSNRLDATYTTAYYDTRNDELASVGHLYSLATFTYAHLWKDFTWTSQISYKGSDGYQAIGGYEQGGVGLEFMQQFDFNLTHRWALMASATYGTKLFNKFGANLGLTYAANKGWAFGLKAAYRYTLPMYLYTRGDDEWYRDYKRYSMFMLTPNAEKSWERVKLNASLDLIALDFKNFYYNVNVKSKVFINQDNISSVGLMAGFGSFPELNFFDQNTMNGISNVNAMVGIEGIYLLTKNLFVSLAGMWNTYYNPAFLPAGYAVASYRNIYSITAGLHLAF